MLQRGAQFVGDTLSKTAKNMNVENALGVVDELGSGDADRAIHAVPNPVSHAMDAHKQLKQGDAKGAAVSAAEALVPGADLAVDTFHKLRQGDVSGAIANLLPLVFAAGGGKAAEAAEGESVAAEATGKQPVRSRSLPRTEAPPRAHDEAAPTQPVAPAPAQLEAPQPKTVDSVARTEAPPKAQVEPRIKGEKFSEYQKRTKPATTARTEAPPKAPSKQVEKSVVPAPKAIAAPEPTPETTTEVEKPTTQVEAPPKAPSPSTHVAKSIQKFSDKLPIEDKDIPKIASKVNSLSTKYGDGKPPKFIDSGIEQEVWDIGNGKVLKVRPFVDGKDDTASLLDVENKLGDYANKAIHRESLPSGVGIEIAPKLKVATDLTDTQIKEHYAKIAKDTGLLVDTSKDNLGYDKEGNLKLIDLGETQPAKPEDVEQAVKQADYLRKEEAAGKTLPMFKPGEKVEWTDAGGEKRQGYVLRDEKGSKVDIGYKADDQPSDGFPLEKTRLKKVAAADKLKQMREESKKSTRERPVAAKDLEKIKAREQALSYARDEEPDANAQRDAWYDEQDAHDMKDWLLLPDGRAIDLQPEDVVGKPRLRGNVLLVPVRDPTFGGVIDEDYSLDPDFDSSDGPALRLQKKLWINAARRQFGFPPKYDLGEALPEPPRGKAPAERRDPRD